MTNENVIAFGMSGYTRHVIETLGPRIRSEFTVIRRYGPPSEYPAFWAEARQAAKRSGKLPMVAIGHMGRQTCLLPEGWAGGSELNPRKFALMSEWELLQRIDAEVMNSAAHGTVDSCPTR